MACAQMDDISNTRATRRTFVKGVVAAGAGVTASAYIKPGMRALGVPGALAQVSGEPTSATPVDSTTTAFTDPSVPAQQLPLLPSTGAGGPTDTSSDSSTSTMLPLIGVALAGGLLGRQVVRALREDYEATTRGTATES